MPRCGPWLNGSERREAFEARTGLLTTSWAKAAGIGHITGARMIVRARGGARSITASRALALLLPATGLACSSGEAPEENGTGDQATWRVEARPLLVIGETDGADEYLFERIGAARFLSDGRIAVADRGRSSIRVYDQTGRFTSELGRRGEGPGEFQYIGDLEVTPPDTLEIYDAQLHRLTRAVGDQVISTRSFTGASGYPEIYLGRFSNADHALAWIEQRPRDRSASLADPMIFGRFDDDGTLQTILGRTTGFVREGRGPVPFTPSLHAFLVNDSVYFTNGLSPSLTVLDGYGVEVRSFGISSHRPSPESAWNEMEAELYRRGDTASVERLEGISDRETVPEVSEVILDREGRFWFKRYAPTTDSHWLGGWDGARGGQWEVVHPKTGLVAKVELPADLILLDARAGRILGMTRDELGVERIAVFVVDQ